MFHELQLISNNEINKKLLYVYWNEQRDNLDNISMAYGRGSIQANALTPGGAAKIIQRKD